jgi:hypothetical protein
MKDATVSVPEVAGVGELTVVSSEGEVRG